MEHIHVWEPGAVLHDPARICNCGRFEQISKAHFKELFKRSFWSWAKEYADIVYIVGGYASWKRESRVYKTI